MAVVGLGIDLASVGRFERLLGSGTGPRFVERCFTEAERATCDRRRHRAECYAARFAAKEALIKALGGVRGWRWKDMEVVRGEGAPSFRLAGVVAREVERRRVRALLALTHDGGMAAASVVLEAIDATTDGGATTARPGA